MVRNNKINSLGILIKRPSNNKLETIYMNWNAHAPIIRNLIKLAKLICSDEILVKEEIKYLTKVFHKVNHYPMSTVNKIAQQEPNDGQSKKKEQKLMKLVMNCG